MPTGGEVVAARLGTIGSGAETDLGSTNFVLTRHRWNDTPYFMLFQHLELAGAGEILRGDTEANRPCLRWLADACGHRVTTEMNMRADPFGDEIGTLQAGDRVLLRGGPLDPVEPSDAFGADTEGAVEGLQVPASAHVREDGGYLWARVRVLRSSGDLEAGTVGAMAIRKISSARDYIDGDGVLSTEQRQSLAAGEVTGLDTPVSAGEVLGWTGPFGPEAGTNALPELSDTARKLMRRHLGRAGQIASLQIPRACLVHWEVFSEEPVFGLEHREANGSLREGLGADDASIVPIRWNRAEDLDDDLAIDSKQVLDALTEAQELTNEGWPWSEDYGELTQEEVLRFYFQGYGSRLQTCACRFHTAWGLADAESTAEKAGWDVEATDALQWWDDVARVVDGFPETKHVWHYPPIEALRAIQWAADRARPRFFVELGGETCEVERFEDIRDRVFGAMNVEASTIPDLTASADAERVEAVRDRLHGTDVTVRIEDDEASFAPVLLQRHRLGWLDGWFAGVGSARRDTPDLYELLIDPADTDGIPDLSDFDANVWASISHSEGHLKAINTYDTAFVSVGPIQQTIGARDYKGELQGALHTAREEAPAAYEQCLGRHGFEIVEPAVELGAKKAHAELSGATLADPDSKHQLRDFIWAYRLAEAFGDPALREPMLREGFERLRRIRAREVSFDVEVSGTTHTIEATLGELFRTDLAQALLLDTHVNLPALVWSQDDERSIAIQAVKDVFEANGLTIPSIMSREHDLQLVAALMEERVATRMSDPVGRAIGILKYTDNDVVEDLTRVNASMRELPDNRVETLLIDRLELTESEAQNDWDEIQAHNRKALFLHT